MAPTFDDKDCAPSVPFYERVAWFTLISGALVYGIFASAVLATPAAGQTVWRVVVLFTVAITVQGVAISVARPLLSLRHPEEARAPLDERDRMISHRAFKAAYLALLAAVVALAMGAPLASTAWQFTFAAYLATILADMVRMTATILGYRRNG